MIFLCQIKFKIMQLEKGKTIAFKVDNEFLEFINTHKIEVKADDTGLSLVKKLMNYQSSGDTEFISKNEELIESLKQLSELNDELNQLNQSQISDLNKATAVINDIYEHIEELLIIQFALQKEEKSLTIKQLVDTLVIPYREKGFLIISDELKKEYYEQKN